MIVEVTACKTTGIDKNEERMNNKILVGLGGRESKN